jgi:hypothetical protein
VTGGTAHPELDIHSFAFRYSCYSEFGWDYHQVRQLPEDEAMLLAVVFEETGAYQYKKNKELERGTGSGSGADAPMRTGLKDGFEVDFVFGDDDPNDYWSGTDLID